jgi:3-isopropylmalate/(R)-2-methylmalate dehydratase small subunit
MVSRITEIAGKAITLKGSNIDTDRIIPARFLKELTFDELGKSAFIDDRTQLKEQGLLHPLDEPRFKGASVLVVNVNFGCGSSREAAPQALFRHGIRAIIGVSYGDIFFSSSIAIGMPCVHVANDIAKKIQSLTDQGGVNIEINIKKREILVDKKHLFKCSIDDGVREQLLNGTWDALYDLTQHSDKIEEVYNKLPYTSWKTN